MPLLIFPALCKALCINFPVPKARVMMLGAKLTHKRFIPIGFFSPQMMVEMTGTDRDGKLLS